MSAPEDAAGKDACVLVVDDDEDIREALREAVEMIGCKAVVASNGAIALEMLETLRPCIVVLDLLMPIMTGTEMLEAMKRRPHLADLPVVISTSAPSRAPTGVPILPKPIDLQAFWSRLRQSCRCLGPATTSTSDGKRASNHAATTGIGSPQECRGHLDEGRGQNLG